MHGLIGKVANNQQPVQSLPRNKNQRTFFGESRKDRSVQKMPCHVCGRQHAFWRCRKFAQKNPTERWNIAKRAQLCYRCFADGHYGKICPNSRTCGKNGCHEIYHRLLHQHDRSVETLEPTSNARNQTEPERVDADQKEQRAERDNLSADQAASVTEGKEQQHAQQTTMMTQNNSTADSIALRTAPIILRNGDRSLKVNALLDEASTKTYVNADVAAELGLQGKTENVTVNVLNSQIETSETKPVNFELLSVDCKVNMNVTAYTANRVTGDMTVIDWNEYRSKWPYLRKINFPLPAKKQVVRIVFDASAKYEGILLNDRIHQGSKLQRDLFDVLLRFRRFPVAVVYDIAEMYLRIRISPEDKTYHKFLWRGINQNRTPDVYEFDRIVFGVNSSPFLAQFFYNDMQRNTK